VSRIVLLLTTLLAISASWALMNTAPSGGLVGFDVSATSAGDATIGSPSIPMKAVPSGTYIFSKGKLSQSNQAAASAGTAISQDNCDGVRWKADWSAVEPTPDNYDWQYLDAAVALAAANGKRCDISVNAGINSPAWLFAPPYSAQSYTMVDTPAPAQGQKVPLPGDPVFMSRWQKFVSALGTRYNNNFAVASIVICGVGWHDEWQVAGGVQDTSALGSTQAEVNTWKAAAKQVVDFYMTAFPSTTVRGVLALPFNPQNAFEDPTTSMKEVSDYANGKYGCRFCYSIAGLTASISTAYPPANEVFQHWVTNPTSSEVETANLAPDAFNEVLHTALNLKMRMMEIYKVDFENPALQSYTVSSGVYAGETGGITPRRADFLAIPAPTPCSPIPYFETESLSVQALQGATHSIISDANLSNGAGTQLNATGTGQYVTYTVPVSDVGTYKVQVRVKSGPDRGIFRLAISGVAQGKGQDEYTSKVGYSIRELGTVTFFSNGNKTFRFLVSGKNTHSSGYSIALDYIELLPTTRLETESLKVQSITPLPSGYTSAQWSGVFNATAASGGAGTYFNANAIGDYITYTVPVVQAGTYDVRIGVQTKSNKGIFQLAINGTSQGQSQDEYDSTVRYVIRDLGTVFLNSGNQAFKFNVTGKNTSSTGYTLAFDYIELLPVQ
jgi:hypothetical protein